MRKITSFISLSFIIIFASCTEETLIDASKADTLSEERQVLLRVNMPKEQNAKQATRIALEQEEMNLEQEGLTINLTWQEGDLLHFYFVDGMDSNKDATRTAEIKTISNDGKNATFELTIPSEITSDIFHLYGVYGGGGLIPDDPAKAALPLPDLVTANSIDDFQSNNIVMLKFSQENISTSDPNINLTLEHLGSIFNIKVINNAGEALQDIKAVRLTAESPIGAHQNSGAAKYDLITNDFSGTTSNNTLSFDLPSSVNIAPGGNVELWGWFPISDSNWPAMNLEIVNSGGTTIESTEVATTARVAQSGKAYYVVSAFNGINLQFVKVSQEIHVETPGTLGSLLGNNAVNLLKLKIAGTLDNDDFNVIKGLQNLLYLDVANIDNTELINDLFRENKVLKEIKLPSGLTKINRTAFLRAHGLTSIELPATLTAIEQQSFSSTYITSITFPVGLQSIGARAFEGSLRLISVDIPQTVNDIGVGPFMSSGQLVEINVHPDNPIYKSIDGVLFEDFRPFLFDLIAYPTGKASASYTVPEGVEIIRQWAFRDTKNIESITLPSTLTDIAAQAFERSTFTSLTSLSEIPPTINNVNAFTNVPKNVEIRVPAGSVEAYKAAPIWKDFTNISAL